MGLVFCALCPHPPLMVPGVGGDMRDKAGATKNAFAELSAQMATTNPERIVIVSPHAPFGNNAYPVFVQSHFHGDMSRFGAPQTVLDFDGDAEFAGRLAESCKEYGIPVIIADDTFMSERGLPLGIDHGTFVPLYMLKEACPKARLVIISPSEREADDHVLLGKAIRKACADDVRTAFIASGDLSHKLLASGPYGFDEMGPVFDKQIVEALEHCSLEEVRAIPGSVVRRAGQCGYLPIMVLMGCLGAGASAHKFSYEGPFGVGYSIMRFEPGAQDAPYSDREADKDADMPDGADMGNADSEAAAAGGA